MYDIVATELSACLFPILEGGKQTSAEAFPILEIGKQTSAGAFVILQGGKNARTLHENDEVGDFFVSKFQRFVSRSMAEWLIK